MKKIALVAALAALSAVPMLSHAESTLSTGTSATAKLDFRVTIPKVIYLRVGTGAPGAFGISSTVDLIDFVVPSANLGDGAAIAATAASGDLGTGAVTVRVFANNSNTASLTATTTGKLTHGTADTIAWSEIVATAAALPAASHVFGATTVAHPAWPATGTGAGVATTLTGANKVVAADGKWTFAYANSAPVAAGTYGGINTQNSRVTYTLTTP